MHYLLFLVFKFFKKRLFFLKKIIYVCCSFIYLSRFVSRSQIQSRINLYCANAVVIRCIDFYHSVDSFSKQKNFFDVSLFYLLKSKPWWNYILNVLKKNRVWFRNFLCMWVDIALGNSCVKSTSGTTKKTGFYNNSFFFFFWLVWYFSRFFWWGKNTTEEIYHNDKNLEYSM